MSKQVENQQEKDYYVRINNIAKMAAAGYSHCGRIYI